MNLSFNPHKELMFTLMTFGIPRETLHLDDATGEIDLEYHRAFIAAIEEQERQDKLLEEAATAQAALANHGQAAASFTIPDPSESQQVDQSLMSQTASSKTDRLLRNSSNTVVSTVFLIRRLWSTLSSRPHRIRIQIQIWHVRRYNL